MENLNFNERKKMFEDAFRASFGDKEDFKKYVSYIPFFIKNFEERNVPEILHTISSLFPEEMAKHIDTFLSILEKMDKDGFQFYKSEIRYIIENCHEFVTQEQLNRMSKFENTFENPVFLARDQILKRKEPVHFWGSGQRTKPLKDLSDD